MWGCFCCAFRGRQRGYHTLPSLLYRKEEQVGVQEAQEPAQVRAPQGLGHTLTRDASSASITCTHGMCVRHPSQHPAPAGPWQVGTWLASTARVSSQLRASPSQRDWGKDTSQSSDSSASTDESLVARWPGTPKKGMSLDPDGWGWPFNG